MDLKLMRALAGLRLIAASVHWSNSIDNNIDSYLEHENESETPIIIECNDDDELITIDENEDLRRTKERRTIKKPRLDNSTNNLESNNQSHGKEKAGHNKIGKKSNVQPETPSSSCSTILDDVEDSGFGDNKKRKQIEEKEVRKKNLRLHRSKDEEKNLREKESLEFLPPLSTNCQSETQAISCSRNFNTVDNSGFHEKEKRKRQREIEAKEVSKKNRKLDDSKNKENISRQKSSELLSPAPSTNSQPEIQAFSCLAHFNTVEDSGFNEKKRKRQEELTKKNTTLDDSNDDSTEIETSSRSTYFSEAENINYVGRQLELQGDETESDTNSVELSIQKTLTISTDNRKTLYYVRLILETLESEFLVSDYIKTSRWIGTTAYEAVQAFIQIADNNADSTWAKEAAQICRTEAVKSLEIVYERIMKSFMHSFESVRDTQWMYHFMIFLTLCDSESICKEFVKFLINHMIIPQSTSDLEDPKQIIEGLIEHNQARFGLIQLRNVLKKYAKYVGKSDDQTNFRREMSPDFIAVLWEDLVPNTTGFDSHLLNKLYKYAESISSNFVVLSCITATNITLLKSRMSFEDLL